MTLSRPCSELTFSAIDFESAGAVPGDTDVPVQVGIAVERRGSAPEFWDSYIFTDKPILWSASRVHGITREHLRQAPAYSSLWPDIRRHLQDAVVVGHNLGTEKKFLRTFPGHGFGPWLDTLVLSRECLPGLGDYSLGAVCELLELTPEIQLAVPGRGWHDALFDAAASLALLHYLLRELKLEGEPLYMLGSAVREK